MATPGPDALRTYGQRSLPSLRGSAGRCLHLLMPPATPQHPSPRERVTMLLENNPYPQDVRVRREAEALAAAGYEVEVVAPRAAGQPRRETLRGVAVRRFHAREAPQPGIAGLLVEYAVATVALHV